MQYNSTWDLNKASTYIYATKESGDTTASGFFFQFDNFTYPFLVTNKHVAINAESFTIAVSSSIESSSYVFVPNISNKVIFHPQDEIDLCLVRMTDFQLVPNNMTISDILINNVSEKMIVSLKETSQLNYCEDIIVFGAPYGIYDPKNNLSIAYKGITATHAGTKWHGESHFMVDIPCWPGMSGAAVYLCNQETMSDFSQTKLLGIFYMAQYNPHMLKENKEYIHLGKAIPSYKLLDFKDIL